MNILLKAERFLKGALKHRQKLSKAMIIVYLMTGGISLQADVVGEGVEKSGNTYISNIKAPDGNGISHNKYEKFNVNENEGAIFNNSRGRDGEKSQILNKEIDSNKNLVGSDAKLIIAEITDANGSKIDGKIEIYGKRADLILANENGFIINGATFYNTDNISFSGITKNLDVPKQFIDQRTEQYKENLNETKSIVIGAKGLKIGEKDTSIVNLKAKNIDINGEVGKKGEYGLKLNVIGNNLKTTASIYADDILIKTTNGGTVSIGKGDIEAHNEFTIENDGTIKFGKANINTGENLNIKTKNAKNIELGSTHLKSQNRINFKFTDGDNKNIEKLIGFEKQYQEFYGQSEEEKKEFLKKANADNKGHKNENRNELLEKFYTLQVEAGQRLTVEYGNTTTQDEKDDEDEKKYEDHKEGEYKDKKYISLDTFSKKEKEKYGEIEKKEKEEEDKNFDNISKDGQDNIKLDEGKNKRLRNTKLFKAKNGEHKDEYVIVDIAGVNPTGISHNYYTKFNTEKDKAIVLNNNKDGSKYVSSTLGELTKKNRNLFYKNATLIINEVNATDKEATQLSGLLEIAGQKADVVVVNENGIVVNGGQFKNTNTVALSTGKFHKALKNDFEFEKGQKDVKFEGNVSNKDLDLFIQTNNLNVNNKVDVDKLRVYADGNILVNSEVNAKEVLRLNAKENLEVKENKEIKGSTISLKGRKSLINKGDVKGDNLVYISSDKNVENKGNITTNDVLTIRSEEKAVNDGNIVQENSDNSGSIYLSAKEFENNKEIKSEGEINSNGDKLKNSKNAKITANKDIRIKTIELENNSNIESKDEIYIETNKLLNETKESHVTDENQAGIKGKKLTIKAEEDVENKGESILVAGQKGASISAKNIKNEKSSIKSFGDLNLEAKEKISNEDGSNISSKGNGTITAKTLKNDVSNINYQGRLNIRADEVENIGKKVDEESLVTNTKYERSLRIKESGWKAWFNGYKISLYVPHEKKYFNVKESTISAGDLDIASKKGHSGRTNVKNIDSSILSNKDIVIDGNVENKTRTENKKAKELLKGIKVSLDWDTSSLVSSNTVFDSGNVVKDKTLYDVLKSGDLNKDGGKYFTLLKNANIPEVDKVLDLVLGENWKTLEKAPTDIDFDKSIEYYNTNSKAIISARRDVILEFGYTSNGPSEKSSNKGKRTEYDVDKFFEKVEGLEKEDLSKKIDEENIKKNFLDENGTFVNSSKDSRYLFQTSKYIKGEVSEYKGFDYLNKSITNNIKDDKNIKLIGDDYYQFNVISNLIQDTNNSSLKGTKEEVDSLLLSASKEGNRLNLQVGKALTKEEVDNLKEDIVWYVEKEIKGEKVIVPVLYLSKNTTKYKDTENNLAAIKADRNIVTYREKSIENTNALVKAGNVAILASDEIINKGSKEFDTKINADKYVIGKAKEDITLKNATISGKEGTVLNARDINLEASNIVSEKGDVNINARNLSLKDRIDKSSTSVSKQTSDLGYQKFEEKAVSTEKSIKSEISGQNVEIKVGKAVDITASDIKAQGIVDIEAKDINIENSKSKNIEIENSISGGIYDGEIDYNTKGSYKKEEETINKSNIIAGNAAFLNTKENINIKASNVVTKNGLIAKAGKDINISNDNREINEEISRNSYKQNGFSISDQKVKQSRASNSSVISQGVVSVDATKDVNIEGSNIVAKQGQIRAGKDVNIQTAKETHKETTTKIGFGSLAEGSAGALGIGITGSVDSVTNEKNVQVIDDYDKKAHHKQSRLTSLANAEAGLKFEVNNSSKSVTQNKNSNLVFANDGVNIDANGKANIGGANISSEGDVNINAKEILTKKDKDTVKVNELGLTINLKQSGSVTSSVLDTLNTANEIAEDAENKELNEGLAALKVAGAATNLLFNDAVGGNSKQSLGFKLGFNDEYKSFENRTNITAKKDITLRAKEGNIELNNTALSSENDTVLDAKKKVILKAGKKENITHKLSIDGEVRLSQSAGYSAFFGANSGAGTGFNANTKYESTNELTNENTTLNAQNLKIHSGDNTELKGARVDVANRADISVEKNLILENAIDKVDNKKIETGAGANISLGAASNTLLSARVSGNTKAGATYSKGEKVEKQTGLTTGGVLNVDVKGDLNIDGAKLGSETKQGKLNVEGKILSKDRKTSLSQGGAIIGGSGGITGELGASVELGDQGQKDETLRATLGFKDENIKAKAISHDGSKNEINKDLDDAREVTKETFKKGGTADLAFSVKDSKKVIGAAKAKLRRKRDVSVEVENPKAKRELLELPITKNTSDGIYEEVGLQKEPIYSLAGRAAGDSTYATINKRVERENPIYDSADALKANPIYGTVNPRAKRALPDLPITKNTSDGIYEEVGLQKEPIYSLAGRAAGDSTYATINKRVERENPIYDSADALKANLIYGSVNPKANRKLPDLPTGEKSSDGIYEEVGTSKIEIENSIYGSVNPKAKSALLNEEVGRIKDEGFDEIDLSDEPSQKLLSSKEAVTNTDFLVPKKSREEIAKIEAENRKRLGLKTKPEFDVELTTSHRAITNTEYIPPIKTKEEIAKIEAKTRKKLGLKEKVEAPKKEDYAKREADLQQNIKDLEAYENERKAKKVEDKKPVVKGFGNTAYVPQQLSDSEKEALFSKARKKAEKADPHKEAVNKIKKIAQKAKEIPQEYVLDKLNELAYGYNNDKVIKYVEETAKTGNKLIVPDTIDKTKLTKEDRKALGDIFENTEFKEKYNEVRKLVDQKIYDKLVNDAEFKELINRDLKGNEQNITALYEKVSKAKQEAFKEVTGIDTVIPKLILDKSKKTHLHGHYIEDTITVGVNPPIKSKKKEDINKELLNTMIHELTHHDQANLAKNKDNPELNEKLKEAADLFNLNQDLYVTPDGHFHSYKSQPLEREAFKSGDDLSLNLASKTIKSGIDSKKLFEEAKKKYKERDSGKEAEKKLAIIAKESKNIPKEHLLDAISKLAYGNSPEENQALREKAKKEGTKAIRPDTIEGFEGKNIDSFAKIFRNVEFDESYVKLREEINDKIVDKLDKNPRFHELMQEKLSGNEKGIRELFDMVEQVKRETLKEVTGIEGRKATLELNTKNGPLSLGQGYYDRDVVNANVVPLISFLRTKKGNNKEILDTIVHELTHHDQAQITRNKDKDIVQGIKNDAKLLALNESYYISSAPTRMIDYMKQPLEREAFLSGHKLGEKLSKLVDKSYKENKNKKAKDITIEHQITENKNLEGDLKANAKLKDNALIYGLKDGRKELILAANEHDKNKERTVVADSYIGDLNLGFEFSRLSDFAKKVRDKKISDEDIEKIASFEDLGAKDAVSDSRNRINKADVEDNKDLIKKLLKNEDAVNALVKMADLNDKEKALLEELKKNEYVDIDYPKTSENFTKEQNDVIEEYNKVKEGLNESRVEFFAEKTKLIAKETLEQGGKIYFALDGLLTDAVKFNKDKTVIDKELLKKVFDPSYEYYNAVTSRELRYLYKEFRNHKNLKFTLKKQVIENPFKDLDIK